MTYIMYHVNMRVTRDEVEAHRERILTAAGTLFREHGYDGISVADITKRAGLTHGGFYGHFASKEDLAAEMTLSVLASDGWLERLTGKRDPALADFVHAYLSTRHRDDPGHGCVFAALGSDAARQPKTVRHAFTEGLRIRLDALLALVPGRSPSKRRQKALSTLSTLVGAMVLSRAVDDSRLSSEILDAASASLA